jgi:hypothetical protein
MGRLASCREALRDMSLDTLGFRLFRWRWRIGLAALAVLAVVFGGDAVARFRARLPDPLNRNRHIEVLTEGEPPPVGTPFVCLRPRLRVVGVVEAHLDDAERPLATDRVVRVSVYPEAEDLIRDDARLTLRVSTPDLLEIFSTHFTPERRADLTARVGRWYDAHEDALATALGRVRELTAEHLGADELGTRLREDPLLRDAVGAAIETEVLGAIDWEQVVTDFLDSPAGDATGKLLGETRVMPTLWSGVREGYAARFRRAMGSTEPRELEPEEERREGVGGWIIDRVIGLVAPDSFAFEEAALAEATRHIKGAYPEHEAALGGTFSELGVQLVEDHTLEDKLLAAGKRLVSDEALQSEIMARHGPEAWARVQRLAGALGTDGELLELLRAAADRALELFIAVLREVALDETGAGPNPLVVGFLRARVLGRTQPMLVLEEPGTGSPVSDGARFEARRR